MIANLSRRRFLAGATATAGSLVVGFHIPLVGAAAAQGTTTPEVNAWVVVQPDDTVVIRIARSEMGQGTLTGLAQWVAEEFECDWAKVSIEQISPQRNFAAKRAWGELTDDDFTKADGSVDKLYGIIQEKFGDTKEAIQAKLDALHLKS